MNQARKVLLIEDSDTIVDSFTHIFDIAEGLFSNLTLCTARTMTEGERLLKQEEFDIVLLDLGLPDSSGLNTVKRAVNVAKDAPIVVMSGATDQELMEEAVGLGVRAYLVKGHLTEENVGEALKMALQSKDSGTRYAATKREIDLVREGIEQNRSAGRRLASRFRADHET